MKERCDNPNSSYYEDYGGRGITYQEGWEDFEVFLAEMGVRPEGMTLDRIDPDGPYSKDNCRWATATEQQRNKRHHFQFIFRGIKDTIGGHCERLGILHLRRTVSNRILRNGWCPTKALLTPVVKGRNQYGTP